MMSRGVKRQFLAAVTGSLCILNVGIMLGWTSPIMEELRGPNSPIPMTVDESSWFGSVHNIGVTLGSVPFGMLADRWGRRPSLQIIGPLAMCTWIAVLFMDTIRGLLAVRFVQGLLAGGAYSVVPVYTAEIAGPRIRATLGAMFQIMLHAGIVLVYTAGAYLDYKRLTYAVVGSQAAALCALFAGIPETPHFYVMKNRLAEAKQVVSWLRGDDDGGPDGAGGFASNDGLETVVDNMMDARSRGGAWSSLALLFADRVSVRSLLIVQGMSVFRMTAGTLVIISYASVTFAEMHVATVDPNMLSIGFGVILLVSTLLASAFADRVGRRPLMITSCLGCALCDAAACAYFYIDRHTAYDVSAYGWLCAVAIAGLSVSFSMGLGSLFSTINCELFPSNTRSTANAVNTVTLTTVAFLATRAYPLVAADRGMYRNYLAYTVFSFAAAACTWMWLPETKGKTFAAIQAQLRGSPMMDVRKSPA